MKKNLIILFLMITFPIKAFALIEVDITRGNLNPLPLAVSPLSIDDKSKKVLKKFSKKKI
jgi:TolB protein